MELDDLRMTPTRILGWLYDRLGMDVGKGKEIVQCDTILHKPTWIKGTQDKNGAPDSRSRSIAWCNASAA